MAINEPTMSRVPRYDAWTVAQDDMLEDEWGLWPDAVVARWLGRSIHACSNRAEMLGIRKCDNRERAMRGEGSERERGSERSDAA